MKITLQRSTFNKKFLQNPNVTQLNSIQTNSKATSIRVRHSSHLKPTQPHHPKFLGAKAPLGSLEQKVKVKVKVKVKAKKL